MSQVTGLPATVRRPPPDQSPPLAGRRSSDHEAVVRRNRWLRRLPLMPALIYIVIVTQAPFLVTLWYSFHSWNLLIPGSNHWAGFSQYQAAFSDPAFRTAVINTLELTSSAVIISMVLGTAFAVLVNRKFFGQGVVRTLLITPFLVMPVATALLFKTTIYDPVFGLLDYVLKPFGVHQVNWIGTYPMPSIVAVLVWEWTPFMMLIVLAGLQGESIDALEAAKVDGASALKTFSYITLPHLRRYIELGLLLGSIYIVQTFGEIYTITQGGPGTATTNLPYYLYQQAFNAFNIGIAAAAGVIVVIGTQILATLALRLLSSLFNASEVMS
ncbi:MAG: permease component of ABC-type sugar transporter [Acidimicrobiaceae bacterium]|nr:permease component of ABC-type sugar transporter [Acidimicrobiaceae bacterium]